MNPLDNNILDNQNINQFENICLGIDFGTTNSCLSVWYKNKSILIPDIDGNDIIPTVIEINSDKKIIGKQAYLRKEIFGSDTIISKKNIFLVYEIKKLLGKKYSELNKKHLEMLAYDIKPDIDDNILIIDSEYSKTYYPEEIATHLFMSFKYKAEVFLSKKFNSPIVINKSVISVPAYFNKNQRQNIKNSAEYAGLNVLRLINEPTAAAICYGLGKNSYGNTGLNIIVFDFGGGTLDVSLLNINDGVYEVLGSCGNNNLGGSDFDTKIMEYIINEFIEQNKIFYEEFINNVTENSLQKLKFLCEQAKIALSDNINTKIKINTLFVLLK
jgi:molecular chaperone DnaK (HSP70)